MIDKIKAWLVGFRKVTIMLIFIVIGVGFRLSNHINGAELVELLKVTGAAFFASNVGEYIVNAIKERMK